MNIEAFKKIDSFIKYNKLSSDIKIVFDIVHYLSSSLDYRFTVDGFELGIGVEITIDEPYLTYTQIIPMWFESNIEPLNIKEILEEVKENTKFETKEEYNASVIKEELVLIINLVKEKF